MVASPTLSYIRIAKGSRCSGRYDDREREGGWSCRGVGITDYSGMGDGRVLI